MNSSWTALRHPTFRNLWIVSAISSTCVAAQGNATTVLMNAQGCPSYLISLISIAAALPFFLFTIPAGFLADRVNRKKLLCAINLWLAASAFSLVIFSWLKVLSPFLILFCVILVGTGFAFNAPVSTAMVAQLVPETELASVATLMGLQFNISGIVGPALAGLLIPLIGVDLIFTTNAACFLLVILALRRWKQPTKRSEGRSDQPKSSFGAVARCIRSAPGLQAILIRNFEFSFFIAAIPALAPTIGLKVLHFNSSELGLLFASKGAGSVIAGLCILSWVRKVFAGNVITLSNSVVALVYLLMPCLHEPSVFFLAAAFVGAGWTVSASELWVAGQQAIPDWARGRLTAAIITISQGATVIGGLIWAALVAIGGATNALLVAGVLFSITTLLTTGYGLVKRFAGTFAEIRAVFPAKNVSGNKTEVNPA
ncbi:MAG TPA: MFS transporter [Chthoniobacterales bacterium]|nr:MFS transporter [Chthoniobacterales bacterium]